MPKTLREVCDTLTTQYGHQDLWFDWRPWVNGRGHPDLSKQPVVISCSRRDLAEHDGKEWYFLNCPEYLGFNLLDDAYNPAVAHDTPLDAGAIRHFEEYYQL